MRKDQARSQMMQDLEVLQSEMRGRWLEEGLPRDWDGMEHFYPSRRPSTRVTIRLDADMIRWFRKELGQGYGQKINLILRMYWTSLLCGQIKAHPYDDNIPRIILAARYEMDAQEERDKARRQADPSR